MLKILTILFLLMISPAIPPLFLVSLPMAFLWVRDLLRRRKAILVQATAVLEQRSTDQTVKFFR